MGGNTRKLADAIARELGVEVLTLKLPPSILAVDIILGLDTMGASQAK